MGQVLHASAKTTHVVRAAIQRSTVTIAKLARRATKLAHLMAENRFTRLDQDDFWLDNQKS